VTRHRRAGHAAPLACRAKGGRHITGLLAVLDERTFFLREADKKFP
jgi:hypothetical protein